MSERSGSRRFAARPDAPRLARRALADALGPLDPKRRLEVELLVSELVTDRVHRLRDDEMLSISWEADPRRLHIRIEGGGGSGLDGSAHWASTLVERLADDHRVDLDAGAVEADIAIRPRSIIDYVDAEEDGLFRSLPHDHGARDEILRRYEGLAHSIAARYRGKGVDEADLEQAALLALVKAMQRFDPDYGASFAAFASRTISGELKRHLRDRAWSVRVPRGLQEAVLEVGNASARLAQALGRPPSVAEIAEEVDRDPDEVIEAMQAGTAYRSGSLDAPAGGEDGDPTLLDRLGDTDDHLERADRWQTLARHFEELPERQRRILYLRFYEDMTQSQIAEVIGVSQMHVSRLLSRALATLRDLSEA